MAGSPPPPPENPDRGAAQGPGGFIFPPPTSLSAFARDAHCRGTLNYRARIHSPAAMLALLVKRGPDVRPGRESHLDREWKEPRCLGFMRAEIFPRRGGMTPDAQPRLRSFGLYRGPSSHPLYPLFLPPPLVVAAG
jgi:hypothetical protein